MAKTHDDASQPNSDDGLSTSPFEDRRPRKSAKAASGRQRRGKKAFPRKYVAWEFPKNNLEEAIRIPQAVEEKNPGKPLDAPTLARYVGFRQANDPRFLALLRSANQYGLVSGSGKTATVAL